MFKNRPGLLFCFLLILFFIPIFAAWYILSYHSHWLHGTTNRGELISPMPRIQNLSLNDYNFNFSFNSKNWQGNWVIAYIKGNNCDQRCLRVIYEMGQTHVALGKFQDQVLTSYIAVNPDIINNPSSEILRQFARTILLKTSRVNIFNFFNSAQTTDTIMQQGEVFLIDPNGYVMMSYPSDVDFEDVYHDLNHLLELGASQ